jgi:hypothetical protein
MAFFVGIRDNISGYQRIGLHQDCQDAKDAKESF